MKGYNSNQIASIVKLTQKYDISEKNVRSVLNSLKKKNGEPLSDNYKLFIYNYLKIVNSWKEPINLNFKQKRVNLNKQNTLVTDIVNLLNYALIVTRNKHILSTSTYETLIFLYLTLTTTYKLKSFEKFNVVDLVISKFYNKLGLYEMYKRFTHQQISELINLRNINFNLEIQNTHRKTINFTKFINTSSNILTEKLKSIHYSINESPIPGNFGFIKFRKIDPIIIFQMILGDLEIKEDDRIKKEMPSKDEEMIKKHKIDEDSIKKEDIKEE